MQNHPRGYQHFRGVGGIDQIAVVDKLEVEEGRKLTSIPYNRALALIEFAAAYHGWTAARLIQRDRTRRFCRARFGAMYVMRYGLGLSTLRIAKEIGVEHHTSVMHGTREAARLMESSDDFRHYVAAMWNWVQMREAA
jgi:chromosomal replication initiation ATPase DnaA